MPTVEELEAQLEQVVSDTETLMAEKEDEIAELRERNEQLQQELLGEGRGGDLEMRDELRDLRSRLEQAEDELEKSMDHAKDQENKARNLDMQVKNLKMEKLKLEADLQREQERAENLEESMQTMRQRTEQAAESEGRLGQRERSHKKTLIKALSENEELRKEVTDLETDVQTLFQAVTEKDATIKNFEEQISAVNQELKDTELEVEELKRVVKEKDEKIAAREEEIHAIGELEMEVESRVKGKVEKWKTKIKSLQKELEDERQKQAALQKKCDSLLLESGLREVEQQLVSSEEKNINLTREIAQAKQQLDEMHDEMVQLARENENLKTDQGKFIEVALEKEQLEIDRLKHVIQSKDRLLEEERSRYKELYEEKGNLEEELLERELSMAEYERGAGLTEAVLKQKKLKADIKRRDKEIRRLNQTLSERISAHEKLYETCRRLKKKAALPENFEFDDLELEEGMRGQTERLQGLIRELEQQNETLENERLRLLESLRKNAQNMGDKGMKYYGLTGDQVIQVNQFVENLREGRVELPLDDRSLQLKEEIKDLKQQLRDVKRDLAAAELQIEQGGGGFQPNLEYNNNASQQSPSQSSPKRFERHMERFAEEQASLVSEIKMEVQRTLSNVVQQYKGSGRFSPTSPASPKSPKQDPGYEKLMHMLQSKLNEGRGGAEMDREQVESMHAELERQSAMNEQLVKQLQQAEGLLSQLSLSGGRLQPQQAEPSIGLIEQNLKTPLSKKFHDEQLSSLRLPPEEWTEPYILLNNRLSICIEQLVKREKEIIRLEKSLVEYEDKMDVYSNQMAILYREHLQTKLDYDNNTDELKKQVDEARGERDALRTKARRLDTLCAVLESDGESDVRNHIRELTRKLAILEVNEVVLARRYNLIAEEEKSARNEKELLQHEMVQTETALRERVLYLEEWKAGAQVQLLNLQKSIDLCVPRESHDIVVRNLASIKHKYRTLLSREAQLRSKTSGAQPLRRRVHELETELEVMRADYLKTRQELKTSKEQIEWLKSTKQQDTDATKTTSQVEELVQQVAKYKGEALEKEIILASAVKKSEILEKRTGELVKELQDETSRADQADLSLESSREITSKVEKELIELRDTYQGGATRAEKTILLDRIQELENMYESLCRENVRYRELANIASNQVDAIEGFNSSKDMEINQMRQQLRDVNSRSDDDAIIGKVQHELTTTKVSYHMFVRKFERAKVIIKRNELEIRKLESQLDEKDRMIRTTRDESRARILALEGALERLGSPQQSNVTRVNEFSLAGMEKLSETISRLGESAEQSEEALRRSEAVRRSLENEIETQRMELESTRTVLADLRHKLFGGGNSGEEVVDELGEQRHLAKRLLDLNEELKSTKLEVMRQRRELQLLREEKAHIEKLREKDEEHMMRLEESIANSENALRRQDDERTLRQVSDPAARDGFGLPLLAVRAKSRPQQVVVEQPSSPSASINDESNPAIEDKSELVAELQAQIRQADEREDRFHKQLEKKSSQIKYLRKRLRAEGIEEDDEDIANDENEVSNRRGDKNPAMSAGKYFEADTRKLQAAAQQTIASLKDIVNRKNDVIEGLKYKLELTRKSHIAEKERDQAEIERLTEKLYEDNQNAISKLRTAYEDINSGANPNQNNPAGSNNMGAHEMHHDLLERLDEADLMLERKDRKILQLETVIEELQILRQKAEDRAGKNADLSQSLREKIRKLSLQNESEKHNGMLAQLRGQVVAKDKKLSGLRSAVVALKTEFVKSEEDHEEELIRKDRQIAELSNSSGKGGDVKDRENDAGVRRQLEALRERVERTRDDLTESRQREEKLLAENKKLRRDINDQISYEEDQQSAMSKRHGELSRYQKQIDELKRENRRLKETLTNNTASEKKRKKEMEQESTRSAEVVQLERRLKIVEAQNAALRSASKSSSNTPTSSSATTKVDKWQADKKLERRVTTLQRKLDEKVREVEAARAQAEQAKHLVDKLSREKSKTAGTSAGALRTEITEYKEQVQLQKEINKDLRRQMSVEMKAEHSKLRNEISATRARCLELEDEVDMLRARSKGNRHDRDSLQVVEEQYVKEDELRSQLAESRKDARALEAELLERDNTILELRFEIEHYQEGKRDDYGDSSSARPAATRPRQAGERFKRERDLENVVESMKKVIHKLQSENERLKRSSALNSKHSDASKQLKLLKHEKTILQTNLDKAQTQIQEATTLRGKSIRLEDAVRNARKQLKEKEREFSRQVAALERLESENKGLTEEVKQLTQELQRGTSSTSETEKNLRRRLQEQQRIIQSLKSDGSSSNRNDEEISRLKSENERLLNELNAFDVDFFEEIEDLKYKYQQAVQENRQLKQRIGRAGLR